ncbi:MAG: hypothetical protein IK033_03450, partial [Verrucomicrobia bacterium]|nr:hypothetical protein [Verrucomicrobiota bacterium]
ANRNNLLILLKQGGWLMKIVALLQIGWLILEGLAGVILLRRFSFFRNTVWNVLKDVRRLRPHLQSERKRLAPFRRRSDFWMVRHFLRARLNRWD